jgi:hypothetical protein
MSRAVRPIVNVEEAEYMAGEPERPKIFDLIEARDR